MEGFIFCPNTGSKSYSSTSYGLSPLYTDALLHKLFIVKLNLNLSFALDRFSALASDREDKASLVATDACGLKAYLDIVIKTKACPCYNGGTCVAQERPNVRSQFWCQCKEGYTGKLCYRRDS